MQGKQLKNFVSIRTKAFSQPLQDYINTQLKRNKDASATGIIIDLMEKGLNHSEPRETPSPSNAERGRDIDKSPQVHRGDKMLLPCPQTNRWVDKKLDCQGCHLRCPLPEDEKALFAGLRLYAKT